MVSICLFIRKDVEIDIKSANGPDKVNVCFSGTLYINERLAVPFEVTNKGDAESSIDVNLKDDQGFAEPPVTQTFDIGPGDSASGTFWLQAGSQEGVTTYVNFYFRG